MLEHPGQGGQGGNAGSIAVRSRIQGSLQGADMVEVRGDDHIPVAGSGEKAHDIVSRLSGHGPESAEITVPGRQQAASGKLASDAGHGPGGTRGSGCPAAAHRVRQEFHPGAERLFGGDGFRIARADHISFGLRLGDKRRQEQRESDMKKINLHPCNGHN